MGRRDARRLDVRVVSDTAGFAALESDWDELHRDSPGASPYTSWAFLYSWWEAYGPAFRLRLITVRASRSGDLLGALPLMIVRRRRLRTLRYLTEVEPLDLLARADAGPDVASVVARAMRRMPGWDLAELQPTPPAARIWRVYEQWRGPHEQQVIAEYAHVRTGEAESLLAALGKNQRATVRKALRRAEHDNLSVRTAPVGSATEAAGRLLALHRELFADRGLSTSHADPRWSRFMTRAIERLTARGLADVVEWHRDGRVEIAQLFLYGSSAVHAYQVGASRYAVERLQWSSLCVWEGLALARERGIADLDLAYAREAYKLRWNPDVVGYHRLRLGRGPLGHAFFGLKHLHGLLPATRRRLAAPLETTQHRPAPSASQ